MASLILPHHPTLLSTMVFLNVIIVILSKHVSPFSLMHPCLSRIGPMPLPLSCTLLIVCPHQLYISSLHMNNFLAPHLTTPNYESLGPYATLGFVPTLLTNLTLVLYPVCFLDIPLTQIAYLYLDPSTLRIYISPHLKFVKNSFPFTSH